MNPDYNQLPPEQTPALSKRRLIIDATLSTIRKPYVWPVLILTAVVLVGLGGYVLYAVNQPPVINPDSPESKTKFDSSNDTSADDQLKAQSSKTKADKADDKKTVKKSSTDKPKVEGDTKQQTTTNPKPPTGDGTVGGGGGGGGSNPGGDTPAPIPGNFVKPNSSNTGPRYSYTRSLTPSQALAELRNTGHLSRVRITGSLSLSGSDGRGWVIEDSQILTSSSYGIQAYSSLASFTGSYAERAIFRYVEVIGSAALGDGGCNAVIYGSDIVIQNADLYGCNDIVKLQHRVSLLNSWLHDVDSPADAHADTMQIRSARDSIVQGNRFDAYVGYVSDGSSTPDGRTSNGVLQTGSVTNDISVRFIHNWFAGGHYTIRGWAERDEGFNIDCYFRDNIWMQQGTSVALGLTNLPPNRYGPTAGSLGDFDSSNVWEGTGQPIR